MICERCKSVADGRSIVILRIDAPPGTNRHLCKDAGCTCQHREVE